MILDNLGFLLAGFFRAPSAGASITGLVLKRQDSGALFGTSPYNTNTNSTIYNDGGLVTQARVGKGSTPVTRQDFAIETPFTNFPESNTATSGVGAYNSGLGKIEQPTLISNTGGIGSITEVVKIGQIRDSIGGSTLRKITWFRDVLSTPVGFIAGESINITHEVLI